MARFRTRHALGCKNARTVSTSGIFKKHRDDTLLKDGRKRLTGLPIFLRPKSRQSKPKLEHPLSAEFSTVVEESRQHIEEKTISQLDTAHGRLVTQSRNTIQQARDQMQEVDDSSSNLQRPLGNELLELTRKNGTVITMTLGKRMKAYRELVQREETRLRSLFEQYAEVSRQIEEFATEYFNPVARKTVLKNQTAEIIELENVDRRELTALLEAERKRIQDAAALVGEKAMEAMRANEKELKLEDRRRMQQICESMFADD